MSQFETPKLPEVKFNKNGYEIRTDILGMAKSLVTEDFQVTHLLTLALRSNSKLHQTKRTFGSFFALCNCISGLNT